MRISDKLLETVSAFVIGKQPILCRSVISTFASDCVLCSGGCISCEGTCDGTCEPTCQALHADSPSDGGSDSSGW